MAGHGNSIVLFNDGEEVVQGDFNALQNALTERAWEVPGMADLTAFDEFGQLYTDAFSDNGTLWTARNYGVFTRGGGLLPSASGLVSSIGGGMVGVWSNSGNLPSDDSTASRTMRWVFLSGSTWSYTHAATSSGQYRIDIVTCKIDEAAAVWTSRSFQDATTGALTTWTGDKQTALTLDLDASTAVTVGAEAASAAAAVVPAIPSGRRLLYYVVVHDSTMTAYDCTVPLGRLITGISFPTNSAIYRNGAGGGWTEIFGAGLNEMASPTTSASTNAIFCVPPDSIAGDPSVRILGVLITAHLHANDTVRVERNTTAGAWSPTVLADITPLWIVPGYLDGNYHSVLVDLRGLPFDASYLPRIQGRGPFWANGATTKAKVTGGDVNTIGITFGSPIAALSGVSAITWYAIRG